MEAGHEFLLRMGKTRLRPGGIEATNWLLNSVEITPETQILEVACNIGTTTVELVKRFHCHVTAIDLNADVLPKTKENIARNNIEEYVTVEQGDATNLSYPDNSFDVVINEAMLTMLSDQQKASAVKEYARVLKPGGALLTHDVLLLKEDDELVHELSRTINVNVKPLTLAGWKNLFEAAGFCPETKNGKMSLMNPAGLIADEGADGALRVIRNGLKPENTKMFTSMFTFFNDHANDLNYIAVVSRKPR